jgi:hypothetical protein
LPEGVTFRDAVTHIDARGTVTELFDQRWNWHKDPLVFTYAFTKKPGMIKGWGRPVRIQAPPGGHPDAHLAREPEHRDQDTDEIP